MLDDKLVPEPPNGWQLGFEEVKSVRPDEVLMSDKRKGDGVPRAILQSIADKSPDLGLYSGQEAVTHLAKAAAQLTHVESLEITRCHLGPGEIERLGSALKYLTNLKALDLGNNNLGSEGLGELGRYANRMRTLERLDLFENGIGPVGLAAFVRTVEHVENLRALDLAGNGIGDEGAKLLAEASPKMPRLQRLVLHNCGIGDAGVQHIIDALHRSPWRKSLRDIGCGGNALSLSYARLDNTYDASVWREYAPTTPEQLETGIATIDSRVHEAVEAVRVDRVRSALRQGIRAALGKSSADKRKAEEHLRSALALLDACVEWDDDEISQRKLHASALLRKKRVVHGLPETVSLTTVGNHLKFLEEITGGPILLLDGKRQRSRLDPGATRRLRAVRMEIEQEIAGFEAD